ncbi:TetR family transcriptional regulator [Brucepastera parasyntrophica]|uniref:TetR/AcrR family transcriptional regulator n=1 Tax=Brucepastera parasyntrophica TaxID=2880008 RepID=UPI00210B47A1|nr:TetR/AcrR family transcriptional regulator [Brucepastera parasyntrophica]ULQ59275.1 TetR family transcriptional regulator [Brucepastera parasyntrophica]
MEQKTNRDDRQIRRTKGWIFEALLSLMDKKPYAKISISDICEKAGIARTTFYRYYNDKDDVFFEYFDNSCTTELIKPGRKNKRFQSGISLTFHQSFIKENYKALRKIIADPEIESRIASKVHILPESLIEHFKMVLPPDEYLICRCKLCYQVSGAIRAFLDWFKNDMPVPADAFIHILNGIASPLDIRYRNVPGLVVMMDGE